MMIKNFIIVGKKSSSNIYIKNIISKKYTNNFIYKKKQHIPKIDEFIYIYKKCLNCNPQKIIAIGGGSVIDYAKLLSIFYKNNIKLLLNKNIKKIKFLKRKVNLEIFPTTAGSGSEATKFCVLYFNKKKYSIENTQMLPDKSYFEPKLLLTLKRKNRSSSGFDIVAQSIESILSKNSNKKSVFYAKKALNLALKNYISFVENPNLIKAKKMLVAANYSGKAINIAKTNAPHALSYPFTAFYKIPHGQAVSINFIKVLNLNYSIAYTKKLNIVKKKFKLIFKIFKAKDYLDFKNKIIELIIRAKLKINFDRLNINIKKDVNKILKYIDPKRLSNNPVTLKKNQIKKLLLEI